MRAYDLLTSVAAGPPALIPPASSYGQQPSAPKPRRKRPAPGEGPPTPADRTIQAQPFATVNTPGNHPVSMTAASPFQSTGEPSQKKRGRPNKEEHERRVREAAERGEIYPPPKKIKTQQPSVEGAVEAVGLPGILHESTLSKQKTKQTQRAPAAESLAPDIPVRTSSLEATASAVNQIPTETKEATASKVTESSSSGYLPRETLLTGMQEYAAITAQAVSGAAQASAPLEQVSAPQNEMEVLPPNEGTSNTPTDT